MTTKLRLSETQAREELEEAIAAAAMLAGDGIDVSVLKSAYQTWDKRNEILLERAFECKGFLASSPKNDYALALGLTYPLGVELADEVTIQGLIQDIATKRDRLERLLANIDAYERADDDIKISKSEDSSASAIFVVHGRPEAPRVNVELLIHKATDMKPIVLTDQPNRGATLIEKLEAHLNIGSSAFAVIIMTADDLGRLNEEGSSDRPRARQNVVLELGLAMGALGRRRVAILHEEGLELPSDIAGVAYYPLDDAGAWRASLLGELRAAGIRVDANALLA